MTSKIRPGYTLIELIAVMAIVAILAAVFIPTLTNVEGDRPIKAGGDLIRARMAEARSRAMEDGVTYRLALSPDGKSVRIAPDKSFADVAPVDDSSGPLVSDNVLPEGVTARVVNDDAAEATVDQYGWTRVATFEPLGTCREAVVEVELVQPGTYSLVVQMRGLTGNVKLFKRTLSGETKR